MGKSKCINAIQISENAKADQLMLYKWGSHAITEAKKSHYAKASSQGEKRRKEKTREKKKQAMTLRMRFCIYITSM